MNMRNNNSYCPGLDGAGKTTALYMMKLDQFLNTVPTIGFNCERVKVRRYTQRCTFDCLPFKGSIGGSAGSTFLVKTKHYVCNSDTRLVKVWDVGGQEKIRPLWKTYTRSITIL